MDIEALTKYHHQVDQLMRGTVGREARKAIGELLADKQHDLLGLLLLSSAETSARQIATALLEQHLYPPLILGACLRRQPPRRGTLQRRGTTARRIFRDFDAEEGGAGIPEQVRAEAEEMERLALASREIADRRDEQVDRDPVREMIVQELAGQLMLSEGALDALLAIAGASAYENTRRAAALKIANHEPSVKKLVAALRIPALQTVAHNAGLESVAQKLSARLAQHLTDTKATPSREALEFIAAHHPDQSSRDAAQRALDQSAGTAS